VNIIQIPLREIEIASLGLMHQALKATAIGLGMTAAAVVLALFWSAATVSDLMQGLLDRKRP
jgi:hypothetical protein